MSNPHLDIIILNRNGDNHVLECLQALFKSTFRHFHVLFINDCSQDNSLQKARQLAEDNQWLEQITFCSMPAHNGCPVNYNTAFERLLKNTGDYVMILNNDVLIPPGLLNELVLQMGQNPSWGMLSPKIRTYPDTRYIWFSKGYIFPWLGFVMRSRKDRVGTIHSAMIPTCCVIIRKSALRQVPKLDERYFMGYWDIELGLQVRQKGYALIINNSLESLHYGSKTTGPLFNRLKQYYYNRNRLLFFYKNIHSGCPWIFLGLQAILIIPLSMLIGLILGKITTLPYAIYAYRDFLFNKFGKNQQMCH